jgi:Na+/H+ antiporter NhaD/arsenite permease-like protein
MFHMVLTVSVFVLVYLWLVVGRGHRAKAIWIGLGVLFLLPPLVGGGALMGVADLFARTEGGGWAAINWNVIGIFAGTLIVAEAFVFSRVPARLADILIDKSPNVGWAIISVCIFASVISAVAENVATVLIVAPIAMALARKLGVSSAPFLIGIAICSNLEGTATLIGDPPSMILAAHYQLNFNDFFWLSGRPGIFFAVQVGALAGFGVLYLLFRRYKQPVEQVEVEHVRSWFPTVVLALMIVGLAGSSYVDPEFLWFGAAVCMVAAAACWAWFLRRAQEDAMKVLYSYDWSTTCFLAGVFMIVYALQETGAIDVAARAVVGLTGSSVLGAFVLVVVLSVLLSAFVDNVPYLAAMLPLVDGVGTRMGLPAGNMVLAFGLLVGACLGGNITPIGASANIVAYGLLRKEEGEARAGFWDFVKVGFPFTLAATTAAALFLWVVWM